MFPGLGFEPQSRQLYVSKSGVRTPVKTTFCGVTPMTTCINQSMRLFKKYSSLIGRCRKLREGKKSGKKLPWLGFETPDLESVEFEVELELPHQAELQHTLDRQANHRVEADRESALWCLLLHTVFQWVFIRQLTLFASKIIMSSGVYGCDKRGIWCGTGAASKLFSENHNFKY